MMRLLLNPFFELTRCRQNALRQMDPRVKLVAAFLIILSILLSSNFVLPWTVFALCWIGILALKIPLGLALMRFAIPMGVALVLFLLQSFLGDSSQEGVLRGALVGSRALGAVGVMVLLSSSTPAHEIFRSLRWFRFPRDWVEVAMLMVRYSFVLCELAQDMMAAQSVRLGYAGLRRSVASLGTLTGAIMVRSMDQASRARDAMVVRGYTGTMPFGKMSAMRTRDKWITICLVLVVAGATIILEMRSR